MNEGQRNLFILELDLLNDVFPKDAEVHDGLLLVDGASATRHVVVGESQPAGMNAIAALDGNTDGSDGQEAHSGAVNDTGTNAPAMADDARNEVVHNGLIGCPACPPTGGVCGALGVGVGHVLPAAPELPVLAPRGRGQWRSTALPGTELERVLLAVHEEEDEEEPPLDPFAGIDVSHGQGRRATGTAVATTPSSRHGDGPSRAALRDMEQPGDDVDEITPASQEQIAQWRAYRAAHRGSQAE